MSRQGVDPKAAILALLLHFQSLTRVSKHLEEAYGTPATKESVSQHARSVGIQSLFVDHEEHKRLGRRYGFAVEAARLPAWYQWEPKEGFAAIKDTQHSIFRALLVQNHHQLALEDLRERQGLSHVTINKVRWVLDYARIVKCFVDYPEFIRLRVKYGAAFKPHDGSYPFMAWDAERHDARLFRVEAGA